MNNIQALGVFLYFEGDLSLISGLCIFLQDSLKSLLTRYVTFSSHLRNYFSKKTNYDAFLL
jgi:hypothetical protein